jgi:hypothetical protein
MRSRWTGTAAASFSRSHIRSDAEDSPAMRSFTLHSCIDETEETTDMPRGCTRKHMDIAYKKYIGPTACGSRCLPLVIKKGACHLRISKRGNTDWNQVRKW